MSNRKKYQKDNWADGQNRKYKTKIMYFPLKNKEKILSYEIIEEKIWSKALFVLVECFHARVSITHPLLWGLFRLSVFNNHGLWPFFFRLFTLKRLSAQSLTQLFRLSPPLSHLTEQSVRLSSFQNSDLLHHNCVQINASECWAWFRSFRLRVCVPWWLRPSDARDRRAQWAF